MSVSARQRRRRACLARAEPSVTMQTDAGATPTVGFFAVYLQGVIDGREIAR